MLKQDRIKQKSYLFIIFFIKMLIKAILFYIILNLQDSRQFKKKDFKMPKMKNLIKILLFIKFMQRDLYFLHLQLCVKNF
jgi:hypothetical protein